MITSYVCDRYQPILASQVSIKVEAHPLQIPQDLELAVSQNWNSFSLGNTRALDNPTLFLRSYTRGSDTIQMESTCAPYRYSQFLNRDDVEGKYTSQAIALKFDVMGTWILPRTTDNYVIYGTRKDPNLLLHGKRTAFGCIMNSGQEELSLDVMLANHLTRETGLDQFINIYSVGINYHPCVGPRGFDIVAIVDLDMSKDEIIASQLTTRDFAFGFHFVPFTYEEILRELLSEEAHHSWSSQVSSLSIISTFFDVPVIPELSNIKIIDIEDFDGSIDQYHQSRLLEGHCL